MFMDMFGDSITAIDE